MTFAHVAGVPVEELAPLALAGAAFSVQYAAHTLREALRRFRGERQP